MLRTIDIQTHYRLMIHQTLKHTEMFVMPKPVLGLGFIKVIDDPVPTPCVRCSLSNGQKI